MLLLNKNHQAYYFIEKMLYQLLIILKYSDGINHMAFTKLINLLVFLLYLFFSSINHHFQTYQLFKYLKQLELLQLKLIIKSKFMFYNFLESNAYNQQALIFLMHQYFLFKLLDLFYF